MIIKAKFEVQKMTDVLMLEAHIVYDSDEAQAILSNVVIMDDLLNGHGKVQISQKSEIFNIVDGCQLLDVLGTYNKMGKMIDVEMFTAKEFYAKPK